MKITPIISPRIRRHAINFHQLWNSTMVVTLLWIFILQQIVSVINVDGSIQSKQHSSSIIPRGERNKNDNYSITKIQSHTTIHATSSSFVLKLHRGGASKTNNKKAKATTNKNSTKKRTGSLVSSSSQQQKQRTATGKKKVGKETEIDSTTGTQQQKSTNKSSFSGFIQKYKKVLPLTRIYITMVGVTTLLGMILGEELVQVLLSLDPIRTLYGFEFWRPFTAASFLGPPSIGWLMNGYYLFEYGSSLERAYGSAQHCIFLMTQIIVLSLFSILLGQPFFASSMITAMLHVLSRAMPHQNVKWLVFTVPYWSLPYGLMITDVLQAQSGAAALPHILGILSGHFYHFHKFVWPKMNMYGGEDWLVPPSFIQKRLDPNYYDSSKGIDSINKALKDRKRKKGRKLGSS